MQNKPLLSVVTSIYNGGKAVLGFLQCISNQTYDNIELIIIDDCSTDEETIKIVESLESKEFVLNKPYKLIRNDKNLGLMESFQKGLDNASGEYFAFPESDDLLDLDFYEVMMNEVINNNGIDAVKGLLLNIYNENRPFSTDEDIIEGEYSRINWIEEELPLAVRNSAGRIVSYIMPDVTYCWFYVFSKQLLKDGADKPLFKNAVLYGFNPSPFSIKYIESKISLDKASFYYYNSHPKVEEGGMGIDIDRDSDTNKQEIAKLEYEKNLLQSIFKKYDNVIELLKEHI